MECTRQDSSIKVQEQAPVEAPQPVQAAWGTLADAYGLEEMDPFSQVDPQEQSIEQEYQAYATALQSSKNTDIIKFWEVSRAHAHPSFTPR